MKIKEGLQEEFDKYVAKNSEGPYSRACIEAMSVVGGALDEEASCEEAEKGLHGKGLTGFMAGAAIEAVVHFHPRGEEMRKWWNKQFGDKDAEGTVNPAIITI